MAQLIDFPYTVLTYGDRFMDYIDFTHGYRVMDYMTFFMVIASCLAFVNAMFMLSLYVHS